MSFAIESCYTVYMNNINPAPLQNNYAEPLMSASNPNPQPSPTPLQSSFVSKPVHVNQAKNSSGGGNKIWIIFLVLFAMIIGFWAGYFTNDYLYKSTQDKREVPAPPISNQDHFSPTLEPEPVAVEKGFIYFREEQFSVNNGLNFADEQQCVEDEIATLIAIEDDFITIQLNQLTVQEDTGESVAELVDYQVRDQECTPVESTCPDINMERCFTLENIDGVYHLDYSFLENNFPDQSEEVTPEI